MVDTLRVISPPQPRRKRDQSSMPQIAEVLHASVVIDGTVSDAEGQFDVKLRLFEAGSDAPVWAQTFRVQRAGFGSFRRDSALSIASAVKAPVAARILQQLPRSSTVDSEAFDAFTRGRFLHARAGLTDSEEAPGGARTNH